MNENTEGLKQDTYSRLCLRTGRPDYARNYVKKPAKVCKNLWTDENKKNLYQNNVKREVWRRRETQLSVKYGEGSVMHEPVCLPVSPLVLSETGVSQGKECEIPQVSHLISGQQSSFSFTEDKSGGRK